MAHSLTKYINGHGDAMGGAVIGNRDLIARIKGDAMVDVGGAISPFNAWLIMRGSVTLPLRLLQHQENAAGSGGFLRIRSPGCLCLLARSRQHPQHEVATRQFEGRGYGGMLAFAVDGDGETQNRFVSNLRVITSAVSLGHDESLIVHVGPTGDGRSETIPNRSGGTVTCGFRLAWKTRPT